MKKLIALSFAVIMTCVAAQSFGQSANTGYLKSSPTHANTDTVTSTPVTQKIQISGYWDVVTIQATYDKISGTVGGTSAFYGSVDGTSGWSLIDTAVTLTDVAQQTIVWKVKPSDFQHYKVITTPTGTMSVKSIIPALWRNKPIR